MLPGREQHVSLMGSPNYPAAECVSTGSAHVGLVALVAPSVLRSLLERADGLQQFAPGLVDCCLIENDVSPTEIGTRRRTLLGTGFRPSYFQSQNASSIGSIAFPYWTAAGASLVGGGVVVAAATSEGAEGANTLPGAYKGCVLREELVAKDTTAAPHRVSWTFQLLLPHEGPEALASTQPPPSPFGAVDVLSMTTTVSVSAVTADAFKSFLEFDVRYAIRTRTSESTDPLTGTFLPCDVLVRHIARHEQDRVEWFLNNAWLRPLALSLNEFALNAAYVVGVDCPSHDVVAQTTRAALAAAGRLIPASEVDLSIAGAAEQFRVSLEHRAEYQRYEEQLVSFSVAKPGAPELDPVAVAAAFERLLGSWTLLVREKAQKDLALSMARVELEASRHVTAAAAGTMVAAGERVAAAYAAAGTSEQPSIPASAVQESPTAAARAIPPPPPPDPGHVTPPAAPLASEGSAHSEAEPISVSTLRKAVFAGCILSNAQMRAVFDALRGDADALPLAAVRDLWATLEDFGGNEAHVGVASYVAAARAKIDAELRTPLKLQGASTATATHAASAVAPTPDRMIATSERVGLSPSKAEAHFDKLTVEWARKNLSHKFRGNSAGNGTPRRGPRIGGSGATVADLGDIAVNLDEFSLFLLQLARR